MKKGIIFDMDGTLWDSSAAVAASWNQTIKAAGITRAPLTAEDLQSVMGRTMDEIARIFFPELPEETRQALMERCGEEENAYIRANGGRLYPQLIETLQELGRRYPLYIVSNCQAGYIEAFLAHYGIAQLFADTECWGNNGRKKGENIALICRRNRLELAVYVGDVQGDYEASIEAGVRFIHAAYGFGTVADKVPAIRSFAELVTAAESVLSENGTPQGETDAYTVLGQLEKSVKLLRNEDFHEAADKLLASLADYFDADCAALIYAQKGKMRYTEEWHKPSAQEMAHLLTESAENGNIQSLVQELDKLETAVTPVRALEAAQPYAYEQLVQMQVQTLACVSLRQGETLTGQLLVLNPHRSGTAEQLFSVLALPLAQRLELQNMRKERDYSRTHDALTGLWKRDELAAWIRTGSEKALDTLGVITTDVIHLSEINRKLGYISGNRKLAEVARMLREQFSAGRIYRYDEDEMLVLLVNCSREAFERKVQALQNRLDAMGFGVAMGYSWSTRPDTRSQIAEAEIIMGNDKLSLLHGTTVMKRMEQSVIDEIDDLMERGRYLVYLQPKVDIKTSRTEGAEALIRQIDDELGVVGPGMFIPVLEHYNLVYRIDLFVLEEVFRYQQEELAKGHRTVPISVNFSKMTIMYPQLIEKVKEMVQRYNIPVDIIHIEVTETIGDMDHVLIENVANSLKEMGFRLSMDDFGSHYSNLSVLVQYDFDSAKIDRSMVTEITNNEKSRIVLGYMTSMIRDMGIHCIVEGIETKEQVDILKQTKAEMIQGFYFGKPVPKEKFYDMFMTA